MGLRVVLFCARMRVAIKNEMRRWGLHGLVMDLGESAEEL